MKRILITGGAGFVGSTLALKFHHVWPSAEVIALDNLYRKGSELNVWRLGKAGVRVVTGDVRRPADLDIPPCDLVVDAAAEPSVLAGKAEGTRYVVDTNLGGTLNVLECVREWGAALVFLSTSRVYPVASLCAIALREAQDRFEIAGGQTLPGITAAGISEDFPLAGSRTLYGATKYASEIMVQEYAAQFGIKAVINRCGVLSGPWQMGRVDQGVLALWIARHHYGLPLSYIGYGGKQVRDVLHIDDLTDLVLRQLERPERMTGEVFNVGGGRPVSVSLRELTALAQAATGKTVPMTSVDTVRDGDVPLYLTDTAKVRAAFDWRPRRSAEQIVEDTAHWISENEQALKPIFAE